MRLLPLLGVALLLSSCVDEEVTREVEILSVYRNPEHLENRLVCVHTSCRYQDVRVPGVFMVDFREVETGETLSAYSWEYDSRFYRVGTRVRLHYKRLGFLGLVNGHGTRFPLPNE